MKLWLLNYISFSAAALQCGPDERYKAVSGREKFCVGEPDIGKKGKIKHNFWPIFTF